VPGELDAGVDAVQAATIMNAASAVAARAEPISIDVQGSRGR
jgi:hypothetical protein